jgi:hypothetical protein
MVAVVMHKPMNRPLRLSLLGSLGLIACIEQTPATSRTCQVVDSTVVNCAVVVDDANNPRTPESLGLVAYACSGSDRPDDSPTYLDGVPQGLLCATHAPSNAVLNSADNHLSGYCCTQQNVTCAFEPTAICRADSYGTLCRGSNRPEALNAAINCDQGVREGDLVKYCCTGAPKSRKGFTCAEDTTVTCADNSVGYSCGGTDRPEALNPIMRCQPTISDGTVSHYCCNGHLRTEACVQSSSIGCSPRTMGWTCPAGSTPVSEDLQSNMSRANTYYQLCPVPKPANNPKYNNFCCITPAPPPVGSTCVQNMKVPGCEPGRYGIACYGPDTPEENFPRLTCSAWAGSNGARTVDGFSAEGYPAHNYCCDFAE